MDKKDTVKHGGTRAGAGRPRSENEKTMVSLYLSNDILAKIKELQIGRSKAIEEILRGYFGI